MQLSNRSDIQPEALSNLVSVGANLLTRNGRFDVLLCRPSLCVFFLHSLAPLPALLCTARQGTHRHTRPPNRYCPACRTSNVYELEMSREANRFTMQNSRCIELQHSNVKPLVVK